MYDVKLRLLLAIASTESNFNPKAKNVNNGGSVDRGIMQINDYWVAKLSQYTTYDVKKILYDPDYNIKVGAWVMRDCINSFGETWKAVDCYNKGAKRARNSSRYINNVWKNYQKFSDIKD